MSTKTLLVAAGLLLFAEANGQTLRLTQTIPLPGVEGRIDHMSIDAAGGRLFVAALGNNTVEVVDLHARKVIRSLKNGLSEPQGVFFLAEFNRLYVANGGDGAVRVFDTTSFETVATVKFDDDADNVRYDAAAKQVYVGYGSGALGIIDATTNTVVGTIPLSAHPESFQLETSGSRLFVNVPQSHTIAVLDRASRQIIGHWSLGLAAANFPMALDEAHHRAFVACRAPARLLVFNTASGKEIAKLNLHGDCDDVFFDRRRRQIYASCGEGFIDAFTQMDEDHYARTAAMPTVAKARTCFFDGDSLQLAVPRRGNEEAQIRTFAILP